MDNIAAFFQFVNDNPKFLWAVFSFFIVAALVISAIRAHLSDENSFDLFKLFAIDSSTKLLSDSKARLNSAFLITSWAFVYLTLSDKLTEWYVAVFLTAWVSDRVAARLQKPSDSTPPKPVPAPVPTKTAADPDPER
jgi:hypothetical protein